MYYSKAQNHFFYEKNDENILYIRAEKNHSKYDYSFECDFLDREWLLNVRFIFFVFLQSKVKKNSDWVHCWPFWFASSVYM